MNRCWRSLLRQYSNGEVVEGTVIDVKPDEIILNIGYKADGIITRSEYTNEPNVDLTTDGFRWRYHDCEGFKGKRRGRPGIADIQDVSLPKREMRD